MLLMLFCLLVFYNSCTSFFAPSFLAFCFLHQFTWQQAEFHFAVKQLATGKLLLQLPFAVCTKKDHDPVLEWYSSTTGVRSMLPLKSLKSEISLQAYWTAD